MRRRKHHEEHANHEAWAIPYGDLITLLLAFFVVMYAISTLNEGKYRVLSQSLTVAFSGAIRTTGPVLVGEPNSKNIQDPKSQLTPQGGLIGQHDNERDNTTVNTPAVGGQLSPMDRIVGEVEKAMQDLIQQQLLTVRRNGANVEIEIRTDLLFPSGSANMVPDSITVMQTLADTLKPLPYAMRVEGYTDNRPIKNAVFPSNWELSAARAANVVHVFTERGVDPNRLTVLGFGEYRPQADNNTEAGRNANRRVRVVILSNSSNDELKSSIETAIDSPTSTAPPVANTPIAASNP